MNRSSTRTAALVRHRPPLESRRQLGAAAGALGQQPQADGARHRFGIAGMLLGISRNVAGGTGVVGSAGGTPAGARHDQKSTGAGSGSIGVPESSTRAPMPSFSLMRFSISSARSGLSRRNVRTFSLPWPS